MSKISDIKKRFPVFAKNPKLVYLDSASSSLKLDTVIKKLNEYYVEYPVNVKRGIYTMAQKATDEYEKSRSIISEFIHATSSDEVIFTSGTTDGINAIAYGLGRKIVASGDEIVVTVMEHHANFVPWQILAQETGATLKVVDIDESGRLAVFGENGTQILLDGIITKKTKILALTAVSNVLGTVNPVKDIIRAARTINPEIVVVVDGAQMVSRRKTDVQDMDCDFLVFSGHKMYGPTGVGVLWGKMKYLMSMYPFKYGGEMIEKVTLEQTTFALPPHKFEAGTPPIAEAIALKEAAIFLEEIGFLTIEHHERALIKKLHKSLATVFGRDIIVYGPRPSEQAGVLSFTMRGIHAHDIASVLDEGKIAVRAGHHCTMPLHRILGVPASVRVSVGIYSTEEDLTSFLRSLTNVKKLLIRA